MLDRKAGGRKRTLKIKECRNVFNVDIRMNVSDSKQTERILMFLTYQLDNHAH